MERERERARARGGGEGKGEWEEKGEWEGDRDWERSSKDHNPEWLKNTLFECPQDLLQLAAHISNNVLDLSGKF